MEARNLQYIMHIFKKIIEKKIQNSIVIVNDVNMNTMNY